MQWRSLHLFWGGGVDPENVVQSLLEVPQLASGKVRILSRASDCKVLSSFLCHRVSHSCHIMHRSRGVYRHQKIGKFRVPRCDKTTCDMLNRKRVSWFYSLASQ